MFQCKVLMKNVAESRHTRVLNRQRAKYEVLQQWKLGGHSNQGHHTDKDIHSQACPSQQATPEQSKKWVINLSDQPLTEEQEKHLAQGPKFVIKPKLPPVEEYITAIEKACPKLEQGSAEELRVEVKKILKKAQNANRSPSNITKEEYKALQELKKDKERIILTADKGVALVIMNKNDYITKWEELLTTSTYKQIPEDPTNRHKARLINILKNIKSEGGLNEDSYKKMYPTGAVSSKYYGLPKIHKAGTPLRSIISSIGTATYNTAKELARILKPLVGTSNHHAQNTRDFIEQIKDVRLKDGETIMSYDVTSLFTSVPIQSALDIIQQRLTKDQELYKRTSMTIKHIVSLPEFCLNSTSFMFQGKHYQQMEGAAMGSLLSPIVANIFMEHFEKQALESAPHPPSLWKRYVDDTFVILEKSHQEEISII